MKRNQTLAFALTIIANFSIAEIPQKIDNMPASLLDNVILHDVQSAQDAAEALKQALQSDSKQSEARSEAIDAAFADLVTSWKAVQTVYVVGELDSDMIDTPRLIDAYHDGKEDLIKQLQRLLKSNDPAKVALFKNTFKSINALAFYLYADSQLSPTERDYALFTVNTLAQRFARIADSYTTHREAFVADSEASLSYVLNALIDSSYKLKEWRVGDPAGLSRKYKDNPDSRRQEYPYSQQSLNAITAILRVHADMIGERDYSNLGSTAIAQGAVTEVKKIRQLIADAQAQAKKLSTANTAKDSTDFSQPRFKTLFATLGALNDAYYQSLVQALPVQAKILDADGD